MKEWRSGEGGGGGGRMMMMKICVWGDAAARKRVISKSCELNENRPITEEKKKHTTKTGYS